LRDASAKYLEYCELQFDYSTFIDKKKALKELGQKTGNITLDKVDPATILHKVLMPQKTGNLYNKRRKDLHSFFEYARKFHGLPFNPVAVIDKVPQDRKPQPVPTHGEYAKLLMKVGPGQDRNLIITLAESGARRSEVFRLTWSEDVDFEEQTLRLGNKKNRAREMKFRFVPMSDDLYKALRDQFKRRLSHSDFVFQNRAVWKDKEGRVVKRHPNYGGRFTARRRFMRGLCKEAGVKPMGFHALRRYFASKLIEDGKDLETIRYLMGHATVSTTDRYIYRLKSDRRTAVNNPASEKKKHTKKHIKGAREK
jgi:integrase